MKQRYTALQIAKNWMKLAVLLGIAPWAYFYATTLAPIVHHALGLQHIKLGYYLIPILIPPSVLFWLLLDKTDFVEESPAQKAGAGEPPVTVRYDSWGIYIKREKIAWGNVKQIIIRIEGKPLPYAHWHIGNGKEGIIVPNDAVGGQELFFKIFPARFAGYDCDHTYQTIINACAASKGSFAVWNAAA